MDSFEMGDLIRQSPVLKYRFTGCYPYDKVPRLQAGTFQIINTANANEIGEHWLLLTRHNRGQKSPSKSKHKDEIIFYDSFGRSLNIEFSSLCENLRLLYKHENIVMKQFYPSKSLTQSSQTTLCGVYCLFLAHFIFSNKLTSGHAHYATEEDILRFFTDNFGVKCFKYTIIV